jgi:hypothetical protein
MGKIKNTLCLKRSPEMRSPDYNRAGLPPVVARSNIIEVNGTRVGEIIINGRSRAGKMYDFLKYLPIPLELPYIQVKNVQDWVRIREEFPGVYMPIDKHVELSANIYAWAMRESMNSKSKLYLWIASNCVFNGLAEITQQLEFLVHVMDRDDDELYYSRSVTVTFDYENVELYLFANANDEGAISRQEALAILEEANNMIVSHCEQHGFKWRYFLAMNTNDPKVQANMGLLELTPREFEMASSSFDTADTDVQKLSTLDPYASGMSSVLGKTRGPLIGWNKRLIINAIRNSRLWRNDIRARAYWLGRVTIDDGGLPRSSIGMRNVRIIPNQVVPSIGYGIVMSTRYYENIYRMAFNTLQYVDWQSLCGTESDFGLPRLRTIAETSFGLPISEIEFLSKADLCARLEVAGNSRRALSEQLTALIPFQSNAVIGQPGSRWVNPESRALMAEGMVKLEHPYEKYVYVNDLCNDDSVDTPEFLKRMRNAGLGYLVDNIAGVENISKNQLCHYVVEGVRVEAEKYEFLFFDCRDPAISKRHILNTLLMMDLYSLVAKIDVNKATKSDICEIVNNYLKILMEAKGLTAAEVYRTNSLPK